MNMAFLTAFVFALLRYGLALIPYVALRVNTKKVAAVVSLGVALFYLFCPAPMSRPNAPSS
jgi:competence protein ComEC